MPYAFEPQPAIKIPIADSHDVFPVRTIYCVGRNYADHAVEMGGNPDREPPFFFLKPAWSVLTGPELRYPAETEDLHHEVELVVAIGRSGIFGYATGVDMTRRDLQAEAKDKQRPWESGKVFRGAAVMGSIRKMSGSFTDAAISLSVNGEVRQDGNTSQMIWKIPAVMNRISALFDLAPGDLIYTGTPAGVGPIQRGDRLDALIEGLPPLSFSVGSQ